LARKIFFWSITAEVQPGNSVAFLHEVVFFIDRPAWPAQWEDSCGEFQKKRFIEAEEIANRNMGLGSNTLPSIFSAFLSKVYRKFL